MAAGEVSESAPNCVAWWWLLPKGKRQSPGWERLPSVTVAPSAARDTASAHGRFRGEAPARALNRVKHTSTRGLHPDCFGTSHEAGPEILCVSMTLLQTQIHLLELKNEGRLSCRVT